MKKNFHDKQKELLESRGKPIFPRRQTWYLFSLEERTFFVLFEKK